MGAEQKVAIITGASQGIGEAIVKGYRDRNYRVVANSRNIKPSTESDVLAVAGDIADPATASASWRRRWTASAVSTRCHNAGIFVAKPFTDYTDQDYAQVLAINLNGSSTSPGAWPRRWRSRAPGTSCRSRPASSIMPTATFRLCWRR